MDNILEKITKASIHFLTPLTSEETYKIVVEEAKKLVKAEYGSIILSQNNKLVRVYSSSEILKGIVVRKKGFTYRASKSKQPFVVDAGRIAKFHEEIRSLGIMATIYIPLAYKEESIGILSLHSKESGHFTNKELEILKLFGTLATLAIRKTQLYDETKKALEIRDLFIAMAAHELRTPLTALNGYIQLLVTKIGGKQSIEGRWIRELNSECKRLVALVNELLEVNRIRSGELKYIWQVCRLREIINKAVSNFEFNFPGRVLIFTDNLKEEKDMVIGDYDKILQAINNVLDNAVKYSSSSNSIKLNLGSNRTYLIIKVTDQGKGISKKDLTKIFEGYYRGEKNAPEGMGLGLYITQNIVKQHRGFIKIKSRMDIGTTLELRLRKSNL